MKGLNWMEYYDSKNNSYWEATLCFKGVYYSYKIIQELRSNKKVYVEHSSYDARLDQTAPDGEVWSNLSDAKYDMNRHFLAIFEKED